MKYMIFISLAFVLVAPLFGCSTGPISRDYGYAFSTTRDAQVLNPQAVNNQQPVTGLDAQAAQGALDKYHKSFGAKSEKAAATGSTISPTGGQSGY